MRENGLREIHFTGLCSALKAAELGALQDRHRSRCCCPAGLSPGPCALPSPCCTITAVLKDTEGEES